MTSKVRADQRPSHIAVAKMVAALLEGATSADITEASGLSHATTRGYLRMLRKEGAVHVSSWEPDHSGRLSLRVYKLGAGKDARRPRPQFDHAEFQRRLRAKHRQIRQMHRAAGALVEHQSVSGCALDIHAQRWTQP
jgi:DNA-binding IclR family transcriptional regulator